MKFSIWLRPGIGVKRWLCLGVFGVAVLGMGIGLIRYDVFFDPLHGLLASFMMISGAILLGFSIRYAFAAILKLLTGNNFKLKLDAGKLSELLYEQRILIRGPKIVAIGGGTGLSTLLRGLKAYSSNITAVVTVMDDGGGSGTLREELGILPPGDIRNCLLALANTEPIMNNLLQYRFREGNLKGQSFGNLFLAAMNGISETFENAVKKMSEVLAVTGRVIPVTNSDVHLQATFANGMVRFGESNIGDREDYLDEKIDNLKLCPNNVKPLREVLDAINDADIIIMGPGSLYTSILPNLLVEDVALHIKKSGAMKAYICNIMTQPGETLDYTVADHIETIEKHTMKGLIDCCFVNNAPVSDELLAKYHDEGADYVKCDGERLKKMGIETFEGDFLMEMDGAVRHNADKISAEVMNLLANRVLKPGKGREIDYYYLTKEKKI